ncbi:MAG TPA: hypothetical protein VH092_10585 [Urbifossiella sp.]|nr:hypothetical protein [Urbifossiella sp.]
MDKAVWLLDERVNLVVIDPFPPTPRDPAGVHAAVWKELTGKRFTPPPDKPLTAAAYVGGDDVTAFVEPFAVGAAVPTMPLFLNPDEYVNVPLEAVSDELRSDCRAPACERSRIARASSCMGHEPGSRLRSDHTLR